MSPAQKAKSKTPTKVAKDKVPIKMPASSSVNGSLVNVHNQLSGNFHALEVVNSELLPHMENNGMFKNLDESEDHSGSSFGTNGECDSVSTNGSCSGECEDPKEKNMSIAPRKDLLPALDSCKREKIRQKNERKHQRQKERRAQELHERCCGYLMSRKLEALAQQLVAMGFSSEQATMALIQNEGRLEESVAWLFEGGEDSKQQVGADLQSAANLKIDISDELAKVADLECKFKCSKQEVERAVVNCEGDMVKAEEALKLQKQETVASQDNAANKLEGSVDPSSALGTTLVDPLSHQGVVAKRLNERPEGELPYNNNNNSLVNGSVSQEPASKNLPGRVAQNLDRARFQATNGVNSVTVDRRFGNGNMTSTVTYPLPSSPLPVAVPPVKPSLPPAKADVRFSTVANELKMNTQIGLKKGPVIVMQRPQSVNSKQNIASTSLGYGTSPPLSSGGWYSNGSQGVDMRMPNMGLGHDLTGLGLPGSISHQQFAAQNHFRTMGPSPLESGLIDWDGSWSSVGTSQPSLTLQSSLGLLAERGPRSSMVSGREWIGNPLAPRDYTAIDWTLDTKLLNPSARSKRVSNTWSTMFMGGPVARQSAAADGEGLVQGFQDSGMAMNSSPSPVFQDWTSPFSAEDLLRASRKLVTSPTL